MMKKDEKRQTATLLIVTALLFSILGCTDDYRGNVRGRIEDIKPSYFGQETPVPLADVYVYARSLKNDRIVETFSNENGEYYLEDVQFGLNKIKLEKDQYESMTRYVDVEQDQTKEMNFVMRYIPENSTVSVKVSVNGVSGEPVANALVDIFERAKGDYGFTDYIDVLIASEYTDENGELYLLTLDSVLEKRVNIYRFRATARGYAETEKVLALAYGRSNAAVEIVMPEFETGE